MYSTSYIATFMTKRIVSMTYEMTIMVSYPFKRRIKSNLPIAGIIRSSPYSPR